MKVIAVGTHPDDVELSCGGLVAKLTSLGHEVGIADLTRGELGSSGSARIRARESARAASILRASWRECCELPDGGLDHSDRSHVLAAVELLRRHRPALLLAPYRYSRHPDHAEGSEILRRAVFLAGLRQLEAKGKPFQSGKILYYMSDMQFEPTFIVGIDDFFETKMKAVRAYKSQFRRDRADAYPTRLNEPGFLNRIEVRARFFGTTIEGTYGEAFLYEGPLRVDDPVRLLVEPQRRNER